MNEHGNDRGGEKLFDPRYILKVELIELEMDGMRNVREGRESRVVLKSLF